jgi:predicted nucleic acid-binding protein
MKYLLRKTFKQCSVLILTLSERLLHLLALGLHGETGRFVKRKDLTPFAYWDAGFIVSFASKNSKYHEDCANFLKILEREKVSCIVSTLALDESWFIILQAKIEEDFAPKSFWQVFNKDKEVIKAYIPDLKRLTVSSFTSFHYSLIEFAIAFINIHHFNRLYKFRDVLGWDPNGSLAKDKTQQRVEAAPGVEPGKTELQSVPLPLG